jgi:DNA-binding ferritin-like protein
MKGEKIAAAIAQCSDICAAAAGDIHTLHLNMSGDEFDTMHKKVLLKYYEALDEDYDSLAEFAACYGWQCLNKNESAKRVGWSSFDGMVHKAEAVKQTDDTLDIVLAAMLTLFNSLNKIEDCPIAVGIANWLQGRLEYWAKERHYFNARRAE